MNSLNQTEEKREAVPNGVSRVGIAVLGVLLQVLWIVWAALKLTRYYAWVQLAISVLAFLLALRIYGRHTNSATKLSWIIVILTFPIFGVCLYLLFGRSGAVNIMRGRFTRTDTELQPHYATPLDRAAMPQDPALQNQIHYLQTQAHYPACRNTDVTYYGDTNAALEAQKTDLRKAQHFIFMEYHAIEDSIAWQGIEDILAERAAAGVEVRVFYDDMGSIGFVDTAFAKKLQQRGIQCRVFNPMHPFLNIFMNNRDHRKITVIDGKVGFTGGYNLAEEYFNRTHPYGYWKDTGIMLTGDAVRNLTVMFLEMWNAVRKTDMDYDKYLPKVEYTAKEQGFVQPYADSPLDHETTGENVYMNLIKNAKHEIFFTTPYLIITDEMSRELRMAARRGVDVRIVTPGIPDKKMVYQMTRSYYSELARNGVRIYEYTPGFIHAKQCVCDGESATVGTINMDYRSLYLHFENGVLMYHYDAVAEIRKDFEDIFAASTEVTEKYNGRKSVPARMGRGVLRLFSPLV